MQLELPLSWPGFPATHHGQPCSRCGHLVENHLFDGVRDCTRCRVPGTGWLVPCDCTAPIVWAARVRLSSWWTGKRAFTRTQPFDGGR